MAKKQLSGIMEDVGSVLIVPRQQNPYLRLVAGGVQNSATNFDSHQLDQDVDEFNASRSMLRQVHPKEVELRRQVILSCARPQ